MLLVINGNNEKEIMKLVSILSVIWMILKSFMYYLTSGYIRYFENGGKNMSFKIEDKSVYVKYNQIWNKIKELLDVKFWTEPIYDDSYIETKVKTFSDIVKILFTGDEIPKERVEYSCLSCINIDSVLKVDKKKLSASIFRTV